jgi:ribosome-associated protein
VSPSSSSSSSSSESAARPLSTRSPARARTRAGGAPGDALAAAHAEVVRLAAVAAQAADDKKGERTVILDVGDLLAITDCMVITSASNTRLVATIAAEIEEQVRAAGGGSPVSIEGLQDASWVLIDYGSFIIHIFLNDLRAYYDLERLWGEAPRIKWAPTTP